MKQHDAGALVYFARGCASGLWKIGVSYDPAQRVVLLVSERRESIDLRAAIPGTRETEREMLARFASLRCEGREWFRDDGSIEAFVAALPEEYRGSYVYPFRERKAALPPDEARARNNAQALAWVASYRERHGHTYRGGQYVDGCDVCEQERAAAKRRRPYLCPKRRPSTVIPPAFAVGNGSRAWPEVKP